MRVECKDVENQMKSLKAWTKFMDDRNCLEAGQTINAFGHCVVDVTDCLPRKVVGVHKLSTQQDGPNCWNTSLVMQRVLPFLRETSFFEYESYIRSPFCKEIPIPQLLKAGDIGSIEAQDGNDRTNHIHSFIYINPRLVFHKLGLSQDTGFELVSHREMLRNYPLELTGDCKKDCSPKVGFEDLLQEKDLNQIESKYPELTIPDPKYFCRSFSLGNKATIDLLFQILKEEKPDLTRDQFNEVSGILFSGCDTFQARLAFINGEDSLCKKMCTIPRIRYYRCQNPLKYFRKTSPKAAQYYGDLSKFIYPAERALEVHYVKGEQKKDDLKPPFRESVLMIKAYLQNQKINLKKLSELEKYSLALVGIRLIEVGIQIEDLYFLESEISDFFKFSKDFANGVKAVD